MAYNIYFACDNCGATPSLWINTTVSLSKAIKIARRRGWQVGKRGWICPNCQAKMKINRKTVNVNG